MKCEDAIYVGLSFALKSDWLKKKKTKKKKKQNKKKKKKKKKKTTAILFASMLKEQNIPSKLEQNKPKA